MLNLSLPVAGLRPAEYNPRAITPDALQMLQTSLHVFGFAKPIITKADGLIIAGHQRTKAATALGLLTVPAWVLDVPISSDDEAKFNQLHNGTDLETIDKPVFIPPAAGALRQYVSIVGGAKVRGGKASAANTRVLIAKLLEKYGNWGACVATASGRIVSSPHYALTASQMGMPIRAYYIEDHLESEALRVFSHQYGDYSYRHIPRKTYIQSLAQPFRLRKGGAAGHDHKSDLYETMVLPGWGQMERLIDFGAGQCDYVRMFQRNNRRACSVEFFHREGGKLDSRTVHHMIADALGQWSRHGGFDVCVCDSVLNSVDSEQAEDDVVSCVLTLGRAGARLFFSGRSLEGVQNRSESDRSAHKRARREGEFLDEDGYSARKQGDGWFFQKFHDRPRVVALFTRFPVENLMVTVSGGKWFASMTKGSDLPDAHAEAALRREFNLPWPNGKSVGRADEADEAAWQAAKAVNAKRRT